VSVTHAAPGWRAGGGSTCGHRSAQFVNCLPITFHRAAIVPSGSQAPVGGGLFRHCLRGSLCVFATNVSPARYPWASNSAFF